MLESLFPAADSSTAGVARAWQQQQIKAQLQQLHGLGAADAALGAEAEGFSDALGLLGWGLQGAATERRSSAGVDGDEDEDSSLAAMLAVSGAQKKVIATCYNNVPSLCVGTFKLSHLCLKSGVACCYSF